MYNFKGERWECEPGDDDNCGDGSVRVWVAYWVVYGVAFIIFWFTCPRCVSVMVCPNHDTAAVRKLRCFVKLVFVTACTVLWPLIFLSWLLFKAPCQIFSLAVYIRERRAERAADRRQEAAVLFLAQSTPETKRRWLARGWLVMLRARHQRYLAHRLRSSPRAWLWRRKTTELQLCEEGYSNQELAQEGHSNQELAQAVALVVDIKEEGLFRKMVLHL